MSEAKDWIVVSRDEAGIPGMSVDRALTAAVKRVIEAAQQTATPEGHPQHWGSVNRLRQALTALAEAEKQT